MNADPHKIRCFVCDLKKVWRNLKHGKVARWTLVVHFLYYSHAATDAHGWHFITAAACAAALIFEMFGED